MLSPVARWQRTLYIMFAAQVLSAVGFSTIFPFLPAYVTELGSTTGVSLAFWVAMVFSAQGFTMMMASPIWGAVADRYGRKLMVQRAMFGGAAIILLMAFARSAEELVLLRAVQGLITGVVAAANALVAASAPRERIGYAMGLLQVGLWSGVSVGPVIGGILADAYGFRVAFFVTSGLLFAGGLLVLWGVQEEFVRVERPRGSSYFADWKHVFLAPGVNPTFLIRFTAWLGHTMIVPFLPLFVASLLVDKSGVSTFTGVIIGVASAAGTLSAILLGRLGDRVGHKPVLVVSALVAALFYLPMSLVDTGWQFLVLNALAGAAVGGVMPALSALLATYTEHGEEGAVYGLDNAVIAAARAVAPLAGAGVIFLFGIPGDPSSYRDIFVATGAMFLVTVGLALWKLPNRSVRRAASPAD